MKTMDSLYDWTDLTNLDTEASRRPIPLSQLGGNNVFLFLHHAYNYKVQDSIALSKPGGRQVSMNGAMGPTVAGAHAPIYDVQVVPWDTYRAFTTASTMDNKAFTYEVSNINLNSPYPVAQAAKQKIAERAAAMHIQLGMPLDTWHICDHAEVYRRGWGSYATACCGDDLRGAIAWIIEEARRLVVAWTTPPAPEEDEDNMPKNTGIGWKRSSDGAMQFMIFNTDSGFLVEHSHTGGDYNSPLAQAFDTPNWATVSEQHAGLIRNQVLAVQKSKASGTVTLDVPEPVRVDVDELP